MPSDNDFLFPLLVLCFFLFDDLYDCFTNGNPRLSFALPTGAVVGCRGCEEAFPIVRAQACVTLRHVSIILLFKCMIYAGRGPADLAGVIFYLDPQKLLNVGLCRMGRSKLKYHWLPFNIRLVLWTQVCR